MPSGGSLRYSTVTIKPSTWHTATPDSSAYNSPAASVLDSDEERVMEGWQFSRPSSLALPGGPLCSRPTLDDVLSNTAAPPYTLTAFMAYLSQNHCLETLEFTMDSKRYAETYKAVSRQVDEFPILSDSPQADHLCMLWHRLLSAYVMPGSPREINLPSAVRDALLRHSNLRRPPPPETLDAAVKRIHDLMDESIFIPFLNSHVSPQSQPSYSRDGSPEERDVGRHKSMRRRLSPQSSFVSPRSNASGYCSYHSSTPSTSPPSHQSISRTTTTSSRSSPYGYTSGDSVSGTLTDDSGGSLPSSPGAGDPMTPPTTPPSSDLHHHHSKSRQENAWKKMGMKLGWKKKSGGGSSTSSSSGGGRGYSTTSASRDGRYQDDMY
ncbi:G protein signaling domain-containing protein regulator [Arthroderma uncinatum]|uniref:G protein signaling domain-containing protein regulator n=1 Tax=Arthroderma uncinatum TaxID=74035 RepID=UPI00144A5A02|nr:G protein signaling domain-containing protein regulator [Arthroderma uncinatum]KAF3491859.1 G protein signaling domain-containing protein regulator [Arthroderma uncinatum]